MVINNIKVYISKIINNLSKFFL